MRVIALIAVACLVLAVPAFGRGPRWHELTEDYSFEQYKGHFGKEYSDPQEHSMREALFQKQLKKVMAHNAKNLSWREGINHMSDWTPEEFQKLLGHRSDIARAQRKTQVSQEARERFYKMPQYHRDVADLPAEVDWRQHAGVLSPVKDQGQCGSCWTFASSATAESAVFLKTGETWSLSEQQIASCTINPEHCGGSPNAKQWEGCSGGTAEVAYATLMKTGGLSSEFHYPYVSYYGENFKCNQSFIAPAAKISSYVKLPNNSYSGLMNAVAMHPVAISVAAGAWASYESGVFSGCVANPIIDHAVQAVGYGVDQASGKPYWIVRNSWSATWGEKGFIRVERFPNGPPCGIDNAPHDGSGCDDSPATERVCGECGMLSDSAFPIIG